MEGFIHGGFMRDILFRGKPTKEVLENESLCKTLPIKQGFVYGNLIYNDKQPYIVGPIADANDEYCSMEWWCPVVPETVGQVSVRTVAVAFLSLTAITASLSCLRVHLYHSPPVHTQ
jgi:hypothetical protein